MDKEKTYYFTEKTGKYRPASYLDNNREVITYEIKAHTLKEAKNKLKAMSKKDKSKYIKK